MSLPASQRRVLEKIEIALRRSDPRLAAIFATFSRLNRHEEMPRMEQLRARAARLTGRLSGQGRGPAPGRPAWLRVTVLFPAVLVAVVSAAVIGAGFPGRANCVATNRSAHTAPAARQARCPGLFYPVYGSR